MFSNGRDMTKCQFLHKEDDNMDTKTIAIPRDFSENSQANKFSNIQLNLCKCFQFCAVRNCVIW